MSRNYKHVARKCQQYAQKATGTEFKEVLTVSCENCKNFNQGKCAMNLLVSNK
jgi:hypothetical protein